MTHTLQRLDDVPFDVEVAPTPEPEPFLTRDAGAGFTIEGRWDGKDIHPQAACFVRVKAGPVVLDDIHVHLRDFHDAMHHTAMYSELYAEAIR